MKLGPFFLFSLPGEIENISRCPQRSYNLGLSRYNPKITLKELIGPEKEGEGKWARFIF